MKNLNKKLVSAFMMGAFIVLGLSNCKKKDEVLDLPPAPAPTPVLNTDTLYSVPGTATLQAIGGVAWDGTIEGVWNNAPALNVTGTVPDLGNGTFTGYVGNSTQIKLRSLYDASNIYFLFEFAADRPNVLSAQWYFNPTTHLWAQEATAASLTNLNPDGSYRPPFSQDEIVMMFNISDATFNTLSCYAACHVMSSYGYSVTPSGGYMATNGPSERLDVWRMRTFQTMPMNQVNDCFIDDGSSIGLGESGVLDKNMVHSDWQVNNGPASTVPPSLQSPGIIVSSPNATAKVYAADGGYSNKQTLKLSGGSNPANAFPAANGGKVSVPIWVIEGAAGTNPYSSKQGAIFTSDTGATAVMVIGVDSTTGILHLKDGNTLDPRTSTSGTAYQQVGTGDGPNCIPGSIVSVYTGSRGDVTCNGFWTGSGWRFLFKRALKTSDNVNDVDFSSLSNQPFGVGVMFNGADNEHAIVAGLTLHFGQRGSARIKKTK